ncbi:MAG: HD domain-containing protein [Bacteroidales bacterium]|nr:HD domain-containing protein [Bacteroidales bacterium]
MDRIAKSLRQYIEAEIIPRYDTFDKAHRRDHVETVIAQGLQLSSHYDVDPNIIYAAAAYHDTGLVEGRDVHHMASGRIVREDAHLKQWFSDEEIETIAQAAEDHRASNRQGPRTIYGSIIAEADRVIDPHKIIRRTIQYGISNYPELDMEGHWERTVEHLLEKYAEGGYLRLWIPESPNAARLKELRSIIKDRVLLRKIFEEIFGQERGKE